MRDEDRVSPFVTFGCLIAFAALLIPIHCISWLARLAHYYTKVTILPLHCHAEHHRNSVLRPPPAVLLIDGDLHVFLGPPELIG